MRKKYTRWTKEMLEPIVKKSISLRECLSHMGLIEAGGNYENLKRKIDKFELDVSHFLGQAARKGVEIKTFDGLIKPESIKRRLLKERGHKCEDCKRTEWGDVPIPLELEHIDGHSRNNVRENLKLLCPNCHALTPTYRRKKSSLH